MPFIPHTEEEVAQMLSTIGVQSVEDLFSEVPHELKVSEPLGISEGLNEMQVTELVKSLANKNKTLSNFIGAGCYEHFIPACVWDLTSRGEFMTAYTPYQAEAAQGNLQLLWEYQTMMASMMGLPISNASMYDGATSLAEAVLMGLRSRKNKSMNVWVPMNLHPHYRTVLDTFLKPQKIELVEIPYQLETGCLAVAELEKRQKENPCDVLVINQPNFFGQIEPTSELGQWAEKNNVTVVGVVNPVAMNLLKPPGEWGEKGADIACGEGQPLGVPMNYGGPYFGFLCCQKPLLRQLPGRLVGRTKDRNNATGFTLTLQAREQHIRRGKATSNICTNQGLLVTAATIYMSLMGAKGLRQVAQNAHNNAYYLSEKILSLPGVSSVFSGTFFHEFVVRLPKPVSQVLAKMQKEGIQAGLDISDYYPELDNALLICATETKTQAQLDHYYDVLKETLS